MINPSGKTPSGPHPNRVLRVGVAGTGYWARWCHGEVVARRDDLELIGFWGRSPEIAHAAASEVGGVGYSDLDTFLDQVDVVTVALSPRAQPAVVIHAATRAKHMLLEKPLALDLASADQVVEAVVASGVTTMSFLTLLFQEQLSAWIAHMNQLAVEHGPWEGVVLTWTGSIDAPGSPYANSTWRRVKGGLWDLGPHAVAVVERLMGPVQAVTAVRGANETVHCATRHEHGAVSEIIVTVTAPPDTGQATVVIWGPAGRFRISLPMRGLRYAFSRAVDQWLAAIGSGTSHDLDIHNDRRLVEILDAAERSVSAGHTVTLEHGLETR